MFRIALIVGACCFAGVTSASDLPPLPMSSGTVVVPTQEWPLRPGPREVVVYIRYPGVGSKLSNVNASTGLMLSLHNWGGTGAGGSADPGFLAEKYNVVVISVDYLQSGRESKVGPEPYDLGKLQAIDALRALHYVFDGLKRQSIPFDDSRIFTTGGSGGGNVSLMVNKFAPRTFTAVVDMCGMKKLTDDIAYNLPGGSGLDARYSRDAGEQNYLSPDEQQLRFVGNPEHLAVMKQLGAAAKVFSVHGIDDASCLFVDAEECETNMHAAQLDYTLVRVTKDAVDGTVFTTSGHALGNRTLIVERVAGKYLDPKSPAALHRAGPTDFERREAIRYPTSGGVWMIDYKEGFPVVRFESKTGH